MESVYAKKINYNNQWYENAYLLFEEGKIHGISKTPDESTVIAEYPEDILAPGLVDTHIHGYNGADVMDNSTEGLKTISEGLLASGVTSFLPTTLTDSVDDLAGVCQTIASSHNDMPGAKIRGIFLEGPWFAEEYSGAQNPKYMGDPNIDTFNFWQEKAQGLIKKIAIAPEREGSLAFIDEMNKQKVVVALAHSAATYEQANMAVERGASVFVHLYNRMTPLHHRDPGMVGAALNNESAYTELIADGHHVHPAAIELAVNTKGIEKIVLITDCMRAGGIEEGESSLGEYRVTVKNGAARLDDGNLAGSVLELIQGAKNIIKWGIANVEEVLEMASLTPAKSARIDDVCGRLAGGYDADFIVIDDNLNLVSTYINGEEKYHA